MKVCEDPRIQIREDYKRILIIKEDLSPSNDQPPNNADTLEESDSTTTNHESSTEDSSPPDLTQTYLGTYDTSTTTGEDSLAQSDQNDQDVVPKSQYGSASINLNVQSSSQGDVFYGLILTNSDRTHSDNTISNEPDPTADQENSTEDPSTLEIVRTHVNPSVTITLSNPDLLFELYESIQPTLESQPDDTTGQQNLTRDSSDSVEETDQPPSVSPT